jgi:hypothetical protein
MEGKERKGKCKEDGPWLGREEEARLWEDAGRKSNRSEYRRLKRLRLAELEQLHTWDDSPPVSDCDEDLPAPNFGAGTATGDPRGDLTADAFGSENNHSNNRSDRRKRRKSSDSDESGTTKEKKKKRKRSEQKKKSESASSGSEHDDSNDNHNADAAEREAEAFRQFVRQKRGIAAQEEQHNKHDISETASQQHNSSYAPDSASHRTANPAGDDEEDEEQGPEPPAHLVSGSSGPASYGKALRPGEGSAMAAYVQAGKRIPRRGEVGLSAEQIEHFENVGYVMSGSRHSKMNAVRQRKENQVYSAEEKAALAMLNYEEKQQKEQKVMNDLRSLVSSQLGESPDLAGEDHKANDQQQKEQKQGSGDQQHQQ